MILFQWTPEQIRNSHGKRAINVLATTVLLYFSLLIFSLLLAKRRTASRILPGNFRNFRTIGVSKFFYLSKVTGFKLVCQYPLCVETILHIGLAFWRDCCA